MDEQPRKYDVIITHHARQRWVERFQDPKSFSHLSECRRERCEQCATLLHRLRFILKHNVRRIDGAIAGRFREARDANNVVTDYSFLETMRKQYGDEVSQYTFYQHGGDIFMVKQEETPVLVTILSEDMLEGTVIRKANPEEMNQIFARWRFEDRQRRYDG